jgi:hypothetical protein
MHHCVCNVTFKFEDRLKSVLTLVTFYVITAAAQAAYSSSAVMAGLVVQSARTPEPKGSPTAQPHVTSESKAPQPSLWSGVSCSSESSALTPAPAVCSDFRSESSSNMAVPALGHAVAVTVADVVFSPLCAFISLFVHLCIYVYLFIFISPIYYFCVSLFREQKINKDRVKEPSEVPSVTGTGSRAGAFLCRCLH